MITKLNIDRIEKAYKESQGYRELKKWAFSLATFGLGALYLWADTQVVRKGEIGLRQTLKGDWILLPPGRHSNFPWESSPENPQSLSKKLIEMGPYKIFIVETGFVGQTSEGGKLRIVNEPGQYLIDEAAHTFDGLISIKQETKKLHTVVASTSDNVAVTLQADVRYQIEDPEQALRQIDNIEDSIKEMAEISISQIVSHHTLNDFAPALLPSAADKATGITKVIHELMER